MVFIKGGAMDIGVPLSDDAAAISRCVSLYIGL